MRAVSYSEARENLKSMIDKVVADRAPLAITRQRGEGGAGGGTGVRGGRRRRRAVRVNVSSWPTAWDDYRYWQDHDAKINALIEESRRQPVEGTGKPEPLGGNLSGWWSRRINHQHRLVYRVMVSGVAQCRYHY